MSLRRFHVGFKALLNAIHESGTFPAAVSRSAWLTKLNKDCKALSTMSLDIAIVQ